MKPYVPEITNMRELSFKAIFLGIIMAAVLGAANAYLGLKAGMTVTAVFPAAIIAIAAFRLPFMKGSILEQNIARTMASVGESLVAGAIFTIPAFVMVEVDGKRLWETFNYWETSFILLLGGLLGTLIVIFLRKILCNDKNLKFPEGVACYEIVKSGQKGESGAKYVFGAVGIAALIEIFKNPGGFPIFHETVTFFYAFPKSVIHHFTTSKTPLSDMHHQGNITFTSPLASPALMGVGYVIGPKYAAINFAGGVLAWLVLIPLIIFINPDIQSNLSVGSTTIDWGNITYSIWYNNVRPIAVGAMLVSAFYTLWSMRSSLTAAFKGAFKKHDTQEAPKVESRYEKDLNLKWVLIAIALLIIPITLLYYYFCQSVTGAIVAAVVMIVVGFFLSAVGGWIVGIIGNSNQPLSGITISCLLISAVLMVAFGVTGIAGVAAVLGVAAVICCAISLSGDMIQDLKTGQFIGGTPWKMELAEIISVIVVAFVLVVPIIWLHEANILSGGTGIGDIRLPAPQAGLMAQLATGIVGGEMPWGLVMIGAGLAITFIMVNVPAPMVLAVGMYLPFETDFAIFIGGIFAWMVSVYIKRKKVDDEGKIRIQNTGLLVASGFIAGEALTGVVLAGLILIGIPSLCDLFFGITEPSFYQSMGGWLSIAIFAVIAYVLVWIPIKAAKK